MCRLTAERREPGDQLRRQPAGDAGVGRQSADAVRRQRVLGAEGERVLARFGPRPAKAELQERGRIERPRHPRRELLAADVIPRAQIHLHEVLQHRGIDTVIDPRYNETYNVTRFSGGNPAVLR